MYLFVFTLLYALICIYVVVCTDLYLRYCCYYFVFILLYLQSSQRKGVVSMKYLIFYSSKGGVGKSTFAKITHQVLADNNQKRVAGDDTDPQQHYGDWLIKNPHLVSSEEDAQYFVYDTQGAHTSENIELLNAAREEDAIILIPIKPSFDDLKEAERISKRLSKIGVMDKGVFFFNGCVANSNYQLYRDQLSKLGRVAKKQINTRKAFAETPTAREINDVSSLLLEILI